MVKNHIMGVYDVIGTVFSRQKGLKIKICTKNTINLVCQINKIQQFLQKECVNTKLYA